MMKAGTYYVGDLCYVLHDEWDEFCSITIKDDQCIDGEFILKDGRAFATYGTAWGDGEYRDNANRKYGVDAGLIGCILLTDIDLTNPENFLHGGQVLTFTNDFETSERDGVITFGYVSINTDESDFEDDYISENDYDDDY